MKCPKCSPEDLHPTKLESDLPAMGCSGCGGTLISLLHYRDWAERSVLPVDDDAAALIPSELSDTTNTLTCPKCVRIMTKYLITEDQSNRLDLCSNCDEAWIDNGEWALLKSLALTKNLPSVFTDAWQSKVRKQVNDKQRYERLVKLVGEQEAERAHEAKSWIKDSKNKATILRYLSSE